MILYLVDVMLVTGGAGDRGIDLVMYNLADLNANIVSGLIEGDTFVLIVNNGVGISGGEGANGAESAGYEIVTEIKTVPYDVGVTGNGGTGSNNGSGAHSGGAMKSSLQSSSESSSVEVRVGGNNIGVVLAVRGSGQVNTGIIVYNIEPGGIALNGVSIVGTVIYEIEDLVGGIGLAGNGALHGDGAGGGGGGSEYRGAHSEDHQHCDSECEKLFHCSSPFLKILVFYLTFSITLRAPGRLPSRSRDPSRCLIQVGYKSVSAYVRW